MNVHPAADVWPMLPDDELRALADDIAANGLHHALVVTPDGQLLAGRNRAAACDLAGIEPTYITHEGDPYAFVLSENDRRGHYSVPQRAMATALVLQQQGKRRDGRWARGAVVGESQVSRASWAGYMAQAGTVLDELPELAPAVVAGTVALDKAYQDAVDRRRAKTEAALKMAESFGRAVHLLAAFAGARDAIVDFVADYGPPALAIGIDDLTLALDALTTIAKEWPDDRP